jgi:potassium-transporting ATPase KdpC subunit
MLLTHLRRSVVLAGLLIVFTFAYALLGTGVSQLFFHSQANGSITKNGSTLIGQNWASNAWFHGRPDDTGPYAASKKNDIAGGDNPLEANGISGESGATALGPRSKTLLADTKALLRYWHARGVDPTPDLVTTSGSGYDPDISPQDALVQIPMVSKATGIPPSRLRALISQQTRGPELGFLGSRFIDVLELNEALAKLK